MDELKKAQEDIKKLTDDLAKATGELKTAQGTIAAKDVIIGQKNTDLVNIRNEYTKKYKTLEEMTAEEKAAMSDKELELQKRMEEFDKKQEDFAKTQAESSLKERNFRIDDAITKIAGNNKELAQQIRDKASQILGFDKAQTPDEIGKFVEDGFKLTGAERPNAIKGAMNGQGGEAGGEGGAENFADSPAGKEMAKALNLPDVNASRPGITPPKPVEPVIPQ